MMSSRRVSSVLFIFCSSQSSYSLHYAVIINITLLIITHNLSIIQQKNWQCWGSTRYFKHELRNCNKLTVNILWHTAKQEKELVSELIKSSFSGVDNRLGTNVVSPRLDNPGRPIIIIGVTPRFFRTLSSVIRTEPSLAEPIESSSVRYVWGSVRTMNPAPLPGDLRGALP
jgi:hypothetical protein